MAGPYEAVVCRTDARQHLLEWMIHGTHRVLYAETERTRGILQPVAPNPTAAN